VDFFIGSVLRFDERICHEHKFVHDQRFRDGFGWVFDRGEFEVPVDRILSDLVYTIDGDESGTVLPFPFTFSLLDLIGHFADHWFSPFKMSEIGR